MQYTFTRLELTETQPQKIKPNQEIPRNSLMEKKKKQRVLCRFKYQYQQKKKERKKKKKKTQSYQVWLTNGGGSTSRRPDIGSDMMELPVTVALVPCLSPFSGGSGSFHQLHVNNIKLLLFNLMCISRVSRVILFCQFFNTKLTEVLIWQW